MPKTRKVSEDRPKRRSRPAISPEARENQLIAKAYDLVEQRLDDGTATSQETTALIKLGNVKARLEIEKLKHETELLQAKTGALESAQKSEKLYQEAIAAMRKYSGSLEENER